MSHSMATNGSNRRLLIEPGEFGFSFDKIPFGFNHQLSALDLFQFAHLQELAGRYSAHPNEYFVSASAGAAGTDFNSVPHGQYPAEDAMQRLDAQPLRILLKRPENRDPRFRELLDQLFDEVMQLRGGLKGERLVRLESAIFITSAAATTPFHFDPEIAFFSQIEGEKIYHVFPPSTLTETTLEDFYLEGVVSIGQVDLEHCDPRREQVFTLGAGRGLHQPQNSPHWVETRATRSISYSFVFETDASRERGRARAFNHYMRKVGVAPQALGSYPSRDAVKAKAMRFVIPLRNRIRTRLVSARGRAG